MQSIFTSIVTKFADAVAVTSTSFNEAESFKELMSEWGWETTDYPAQFAAIGTLGSTLKATLQNLGANPSLSQVLDLLDDANSLYSAFVDIASPPAGITDSNFLATIARQFVSMVIDMTLSTGAADLVPLLTALNLIICEDNWATETQGAYQRLLINWPVINILLSDPSSYTETLLIDEGNQVQLGKLLNILSEIAGVLGLAPTILPPEQIQVFNFGTAFVSDDARPALIFSLLPENQDNSEMLGVSIRPFAEALTQPDPNSPEEEVRVPLNMGLSVRLTSKPAPIVKSLSAETSLTLYPQPNSSLVETIISQEYVRVSSPLSGGGTAPIMANPLLTVAYRPSQSLTLLGSREGTGVTTDGISLSFGLVKTASTEQDFLLSVEFNNTLLTIKGNDGDSFLSKILPANYTLPIPLALSISRDGIRFVAALSFTAKISKALTLGPLKLLNLVIAIQVKDEGLSVEATTDAQIELGPVLLSVDSIGAALQAGISPEQDKLLAISDAFKMPLGVGVAIVSDAVIGGGYLYLDVKKHVYSGAAQLSIKEKINLSAVGILQTQLPNNPNAYSFLLLITAEFTPIQLGLGFTLNAVGGLIGINRSVNVSYLRGLVQSGRMDTLLFPPNVLGNPETAIATVENAFPAAEGRYVFGIMAKIGWGTPNLITLDAALIIELPAPVRLVLLGVLRAILPSEQTPILRLRADFLGVVDFGAKRIAFDASLVDSRILQFTLTGDAAFRLYQGENPVFLLTSGGFHPSFQPPANADLPTLRRLTLALANGNDFRLTLSSYVAITANTVQFGSRLDLFVDLPGPFTLVGFMGFDALFQFNPFRIAVQVAAGVAIKKGSRSVLSLYLRLAVTGPGPWHVDGEGSFKILFFKIKFRVNRTFGQGAAPQPLPSTDVRTLLLQALNDPKSWEVEQPVTRPASLVVLRAEPADATRLLVNPGGKLTVRQRVVPLAYRIERFGNTRPTTGNEFNITSASIGATDPIAVSGANLEEIRDHFSPGQFRQMSDAEKLSAPSFQTMRSGARLGIVVEGLTGGASVIRTAQYELKIARNVAQGDLAGRPASSSDTQSAAQKDATTSDASSQIVQPTGPDPVVSTSVKVPMASQLSERLARNGAVGRTARSYEQRRPSRMAPDKVFWDEDTYAVVSTRNLLPHVNTPFPNEASATQALGDALRANPNLTGELQVIPSYQLPASVTASNLALA